MLTQDAIRLGIHPSCKKEEVLEESESSHAERMQRLILDEREEDEPIADLHNMKMGTLRGMAKKKGIAAPFGITKEALINQLKEAE